MFPLAKPTPGWEWGEADGGDRRDNGHVGNHVLEVFMNRQSGWYWKISVESIEVNSGIIKWVPFFFLVRQTWCKSMVILRDFPCKLCMKIGLVIFHDQAKRIKRICRCLIVYWVTNWSVYPVPRYERSYGSFVAFDGGEWCNQHCCAGTSQCGFSAEKLAGIWRFGFC